MNAQKQASPDHPIHELLARRWSPYAFADRPVSEDDLRSLFEAARWAASSYNEQPWGYVVATKANPAEFERVKCAPGFGQKNGGAYATCTHAIAECFSLQRLSYSAGVRYPSAEWIRLTL